MILAAWSPSMHPIACSRRLAIAAELACTLKIIASGSRGRWAAERRRTRDEASVSAMASSYFAFLLTSLGARLDCGPRPKVRLAHDETIGRSFQ
jgi:hypothetical protein